MITERKTGNIDISQRLTQWARAFERTIGQYLQPSEQVPESLAQAMLYSMRDGGKRIRPFILTRICELCGGLAEEAAPAAVAIECVHTFSLIHDDLPAMDDDDWRRGRPSCHKAYGEAVAILAGDALLVLAFELPATQIKDARIAAATVAELAQACGWSGMCGGQVRDILGEKETPTLAGVQEIHRYKTARLFECAGRLGALCGRGDGTQVQSAADFGHHMGLAFQIADDLLDLTGDKEQMGKAVAKDISAGKQTYPVVAGLEASIEAARSETEQAIEALKIFGAEADDLRSLANFVIERNK